jgi:low affinity Fe/Cu permease
VNDILSAVTGITTTMAVLCIAVVVWPITLLLTAAYLLSRK